MLDLTSLSRFDQRVFESINHLAISFSAMNPIMRFFAEYGADLFMLGVAVYWFTRTSSNRRMVAEALLSASAALGIGGILSHFFYRDRPFVHHHVIQLIAHPANASFPSDHATGAFVIATSILLFRKKEGIVWFVLGALIALSRVWTGVHYPLDILAGAAIGTVTAIAVHRLASAWPIADAFITKALNLYDIIEQRFGRIFVKNRPAGVFSSKESKNN